MELGFIGLGRMGLNMVHRLLDGKHKIVGYDRSPEAVKGLESYGGTGASSLEDLVKKLTAPRAVWIMVPSGAPTQQTIDDLSKLLSPGDTIIDGGNSNFHDSKRRAEELKKKSLTFVDVGTSGGIWGYTVGYCMMIGGEKAVFDRLEPIFKTLAPKDGYLYTGASGSGHFVKMVHNGIEYGMLQAYAEGFDILQASEYPLNFGEVSHLWNQGSVVRSWLLELAELAFKKDPKLETIKGYVDDSGEGRWTVLEAIDHNIPAPVITASLFARFASREDESFAAKVIAALRNEFGGHPVKKE